MKSIIYSWNNGEGSSNLAKALGVKRAKHNSNKVIKVDTLINLGSSSIPERIKYKKILNNPASVAVASNKLKTFKALEEADVSIPAFTTDKEEAAKWFEKKNTVVVCRKILNGHSGQGIVLASSVEELVDAPLYTMYIPKQEEYRVHVFNGQSIFVQRKAKRLDVPAEEVNYKIRNFDNGFIFQQEGFEIPDDCVIQSIEAVKALGLDFAGVDVIYNNKQQKAYVIELNTACGMMGNTVEAYKKAIEEVL